MDLNSCLSSNKPPQVSRTLLSILADLNNSIVWMVFTGSLISNSFSPCTNLLMTVTSAPIMTPTFMFLSVFSSLARSWYLSLFLFSFSFPLWSAGIAKATLFSSQTFTREAHDDLHLTWGRSSFLNAPGLFPISELILVVWIVSNLPKIFQWP